MCCIGNSIRDVLSFNQRNDKLAEEYVPLEEDSFIAVAQKDLIYAKLARLSELATTQQGIDAFYLFLMQLPQFSILLKSLMQLSFKSE